MYSNNFFKILHYSYILPTRIGACSLHINVKTRTFYITTASRRIFPILTFIMVALNIFVVLRTLEILYYKGYNHPDFNLCYVISIGYFLINVFAIFMSSMQNECCILANQIIKYCLLFQRRWMIKSYNPNELTCIPGRFLDTVILILHFLSVIAFLNILVYFGNPHLPIFLPTLLPQAEEAEMWNFEIKRNNWINLAFGSLMIYITIWSAHVVLTCTMLGCIFVCKYFVYFTSNKFQAQLLAWAALFHVGWTAWLEVIGSYNHISKNTLSSWKNLKFLTKTEKTYFQKYAKSCHTLIIGKRGVFTIKKLSVLNFTMAVTKGTFRSLLTIGRRRQICMLTYA
ncbi:hypothetical protein Fcan01_10775 [Folsomia candida]|uniref:Uncharacterized protein n=1 Tax=Folsomia candida TaxID=158441 RepID=A0A226EC18_FOLCA|nr:hypothetical protein Fcan01_10775 [Folsomia candida]